jgi:hypothetical protein
MRMETIGLGEEISPYIPHRFPDAD